MRLVWVVIPLVLIGIVGMQESFAEDEIIQSPKHQLESGVAPEDIQCKENRILALRTNGNVACVTESTAEKLGWEITQTTPTIKQDPIPISNPTGYWIPIPEEDREEFAKKFASAAGDSFIEKRNSGQYITEKGRISILNNYMSSNPFSKSSVDYSLVISADQFDNKKKFVENFMQQMGFEYNEEDAGYNTYNQRTTFSFSHEFSKIKFEFNDRYDDELTIGFDGWTNNPELVVFPLSEELALEKALVLTNDLYSSGECGLETHQSEYIMKTVIDGFPFYEISLGHCQGEYIMGGLMACDVSVSINTMNQTDSSFEVICYDG